MPLVLAALVQSIHLLFSVQKLYVANGPVVCVVCGATAARSGKRTLGWASLHL